MAEERGGEVRLGGGRRGGVGEGDGEMAPFFIFMTEPHRSTPSAAS